MSTLEPTPLTPTTDTALLSELCPYCNESPPKYRCPACDARTCSLKCSKRHKAYKQCSGTRDPAAYVKRSKLATPAALNQDFNFLSGVERAVLHSAEEEKEEEEKGQARGKGKQAAQAREAFIEKSGVVVKSAPRGMKRARENKTDVVRTKKQRVLCWTVEWIVCDEGNRRVLDDRVSESARLTQAFFYPNNRVGESRKRPKAVVAKTRFYLKKVGTPANRPTLISLNPAAELKDCLRGRMVEEYPTIYITAGQSHPAGFEVDESIAADAGGKLEVLEESSKGGVEVNLDALEKIIAEGGGSKVELDGEVGVNPTELQKGDMTTVEREREPFGEPLEELVGDNVEKPKDEVPMEQNNDSSEDATTTTAEHPKEQLDGSFEVNDGMKLEQDLEKTGHIPA